MKLNKKPKFIIQTLDDTSMDFERDLYNPDQFLPYMLNNKEMKDATIVFNGYKAIDYIFPLSRYFGKKEAVLEIIKLIFAPKKNTIFRVKGYHGNDKIWNDDLEKAQNDLVYFEAKPDSSIILLFDEYVSSCKKQNINMIFVYTPEYIEGQKFVRNRSDIMNLYRHFSQKYNIPFFDYSNDSISYQKKYFYNSGHLNREGAELFTSKLIGDLKDIIKKE
jgi:hypothetical protein